MMASNDTTIALSSNHVGEELITKLTSRSLYGQFMGCGVTIGIKGGDMDGDGQT